MIKTFKIAILTLVINTMASNVYSQKSLTFSDYYQLVVTNHPISKQANLLDNATKQELRAARGMFDPKFDFDLTTKEFDGKKYYDYLDFGLKIPVWFGGDLKLGYENNTGLNKNPADYTPSGGLVFAGIEMSLNNFIFDERRAAVRTAQNLKRMNLAEKTKIINKLYLTVAKDYWEWFFTYNKLKTKEESYLLADQTYKAVVGRINGGDFASIDSVEAKMNLLERKTDLMDARNDFQNASIGLSLNLWTPNNEPLELEPNVIPEDISEATVKADTNLTSLLANAEQNQPELQKMNLKLAKLQIDKKLYAQNFLPQATAYAKYLNAPSKFKTEDLNIPYLRNNYKIGIHMIQPIFLRKERAKYQLAQVKIDQTLFEQKLVTREIYNTIKQSHNDLMNYLQMFTLQKEMFEASEKMYYGEKTKFEMGEATLFYLNVRQTKMLESKIKLFSYYAKIRKSEATLNWVAGSTPIKN
jgi:outer membrane protein TolC